MSYELRLKKLQKEWREIQKLREERATARKFSQKYQEDVRRLSQEIPKRWAVKYTSGKRWL